MKGTFFNKPLEWNIETTGESWKQGDTLKGILKIKNHGSEPIDLIDAGVGLAFADIKKVHARTHDALKFEQKVNLESATIGAGQETELKFSFPIGPNAPITDKKSSYYLGYGKGFTEGQLQLKIEPQALFASIVGLLDTFHRFKHKETKSSKNGVEYKLIPPNSRDMANIDSLQLTLSMKGDELALNFTFQVKRLDTSSVVTKLNKESLNFERKLGPKQYSLGSNMINQDPLLENIGQVLSEAKMKAVF